MLLLLTSLNVHRRRQRQRTDSEEAKEDVDLKVEDKPQLHSDSAVFNEMDAREEHEMQGSGALPQELPGSEPQEVPLPSTESTEESVWAEDMGASGEQIRPI